MAAGVHFQRAATAGESVTTPDRRVRVFVSSTLGELAEERRAVRAAVDAMHLTPVMFELGARPHPPRDVYRAYLAQSDVFVGIYGKRYGWVAPGEDVSGLEDEYRLSTGLPRLLYVKRSAERDPQLARLLAQIEADDAASYRPFDEPDELAGLVADDLAVLLTERFTAQAQPVDDTDRHNLPARLGDLVGRDATAAQTQAALASSRLVTITGTGGIGKSRLALHVAWQLVDADDTRFEDGVWFVDLSSTTDGPGVASAVAGALDLPAGDLHAGETRLSRLVRQLHHRACLIVLDNCEHVVEECAELAEAVLTGCPKVRVLATSREALGVPGEVQYSLGPLAADDAVELFVRRARAVRHDFAPDHATLEQIRELCGHLDGLPLAIELAAARVKALSVHDIARRLSDRFSLLTGGARTARARQQTLRATVDWSYHLLDHHERMLLRRLSVFRGSWTVEAAEQVCAAGDLAADAVFDLLGRLVDRSLVVADAGRFHMFETLRAYASDRLAEAGETDETMTRHVSRLSKVATECDAALRGPQHAEARRRLSDELDDFRAALTWCADTGRTSAGQDLAAALAWFWFLGDHQEGRRHLHRLLDGGEDERARGRALQALAIVDRPGACVVHPQPDCAAAAAASLPLLEASGEHGTAAVSKLLVAVEGISGHDAHRCLDLIEEATTALEEGSWARGLSDFVRMEILLRVGDIDEGIAVGERAAIAFRDVGDVWGISAVRAHQGHNLRLLGRLHDSVRAYDEALAIARPAGLVNTVQLVAGEVGLVRLMLDDTGTALRNFDEAREVSRRYAFIGGEGLFHVGHGYMARRVGDSDSAREHFSAAVDLLSKVGSLPYLAAAWSGLGFTEDLRGDVEAAEHAHREVLSAASKIHEPWILAIALEGLAGVAVLRRHEEQAAALLGQADAVRARSGRPRDPLVDVDVDRIAALAQARLDARPFDAARSHARDRAGAVRDQDLIRDARRDAPTLR